MSGRSQHFARFADTRVEELSGGTQSKLNLALAMLHDPDLLFLDEPTAGLSPAFVQQVFEWIRAINAQGISILMVEQNAKQALGIADRGYVLATGENRHEDSGAGLLANREVAQMFLGGR